MYAPTNEWRRFFMLKPQTYELPCIKMSKMGSKLSGNVKWSGKCYVKNDQANVMLKMIRQCYVMLLYGNSDRYRSICLCIAYCTVLHRRDEQTVIFCDPGPDFLKLIPSPTKVQKNFFKCKVQMKSKKFEKCSLFTTKMPHFVSINSVQILSGS